MTFFPQQEGFFEKNFEQQFGNCMILWTTFMKDIYLYICIYLFAICLMNVHTWGTSKILVPLSTLRTCIMNCHGLTVWISSPNKCGEIGDKFAAFPPFDCIFLLTKMHKAMHSLLWWSMVWEMWIFFFCDLFHEEDKTQQRVEMPFFSLAHWLCNGSCVLLPEGFPKPLTIEGTFPLVCFYLPPLAIDGKKVFWK